MTNDGIITTTAIDFIRATHDKPFNQYASLKHDKLIDAIAEDLSRDSLTLEQYIEILESDITECCYLLANFAIMEYDIFNFLDGRIKHDLVNFDNGTTDWCNFVELDNVSYKGKTKVIEKKLFLIKNNRYREILREVKTIEIYKVQK